MNCIIPGGNMKVLSKSIQALYKISDELCLECRSENLSLVAINMTKTACAKYDFHQNFFTCYEVEDGNSQTSSPNATCKIHIRALLNTFKPNMDKKLEFCKIQMERDATRLVIKFKYKYDCTKVHKLKLIDFEYLRIHYSIDDARHCIAADGQFFNQIFANFQTSDSNLSFEITKNKTTLRNYDIGMSAVYKGMRSQVVLINNEFLTYSVKEDTNMVLSLKPFRSAVHFAEHFNLNLSLHFTTGGSPIIAAMKSTTFEVQYIIATLNPEGSTQATSTISEPVPLINHNKIATLLTEQDQAALESINWDEDIVDDEAQCGDTNERCSFTNVLKNLGNNNKNKEKVVENTQANAKENEDLIPNSPPLKITKIFGRCFDPTFHASMLNFGETLAENSDSDESI